MTIATVRTRLNRVEERIVASQQALQDAVVEDDASPQELIETWQVICDDVLQIDSNSSPEDTRTAIRSFFPDHDSETINGLIDLTRDLLR